MSACSLVHTLLKTGGGGLVCGGRVVLIYSGNKSANLLWSFCLAYVRVR